MYKSKVLIILACILYIVSVTYLFAGNEAIANLFKSAILPTLTVFYFVYVNKKSLFFSLFLLFFSTTELLVLFENYLPTGYIYYVGNLFYISGYLCLIVGIFKSISIFHILKNYKIHLLVLSILNIYIVYVLILIVDPFIVKTNVYYIELLYNIILLFLLSMSLLGYFYNDDVKSLYFFIATLSIVFAEVIWIAYNYISARYLLNFVSNSLYMISFYFYLKQSLLEHDTKQNEVSTLV